MVLTVVCVVVQVCLNSFSDQNLIRMMKKVRHVRYQDTDKVQAVFDGLQNHEEVTAAVENITALITRWTNQEQRSLLHQDIALRDDFAKLKRSIADLYVAILDCQVSLTRYCDGHSFSTLFTPFGIYLAPPH